MTDNEIEKAIIEGTKSGKLKWKFNNPQWANSKIRQISISFHDGAFYVNGQYLRSPNLLENRELMKAIYREDEEFEESIRSLLDTSPNQA